MLQFVTCPDVHPKLWPWAQWGTRLLWHSHRTNYKAERDCEGLQWPAQPGSVYTEGISVDLSAQTLCCTSLSPIPHRPSIELWG